MVARVACVSRAFSARVNSWSSMDGAASAPFLVVAHPGRLSPPGLTAQRRADGAASAVVARVNGKTVRTLKNPPGSSGGLKSTAGLGSA